MSVVEPAPPASPAQRPVPPARSPAPLVVHKFGGSSLADAARVRDAARLVLDDDRRQRIVVVSAMRGVTDALVALAADARAGIDIAPAWRALRDRHRETAVALEVADPGALHDALDTESDTLFEDLATLPHVDDAQAMRLAERIWGHGELCSSLLLHAALGGGVAGWTRLDTREVLVVRPGEIGPVVDREASLACLRDWRTRHPQPHAVATGFVARTLDGRATTLGRNGSDHSATLLADLLDAAEVVIWTDVDGVLSADPRRVPDAVPLHEMSYAEACELAYFGARVLHPRTLAPIQARGIPLSIRNTLAPAAPGTRIKARARPARSPVKGLSLVEDIAVLELTGSGMAGVPGVAERMFAALHAAGVSVTLISQGSSEHSICCAIPSAQASAGRAAIEAAFVQAREAGQIEGVRLEDGLCVLAAVGDGMVGTPGVAARLLGGLAQARVNVRAIAQGASERNLSVVVAQADAARALRAAHAAFWLSPQTLSVGVIGPGHVGQALLRQLAGVAPALRARSGVDLRLRALADSRRMVLEAAEMTSGQALDRLGHDDAPAADLDAFAAHVRAGHLPHALIVDCSASDAVAAKYPEWLAAGIHVVTPNKHAGSGAWSRYAAVRTAQRDRGGRFLYEATVGAGLPVIQTLRGLLDTGDVLHGIDGMLSGTLAWLFNSFDGSRRFSDLVLEARALGYTEPDPRDDLSGLDVARKLVILAREAGHALSIDDVDVENLVPEPLRDLPLDDFLARVAELDAPMRARLDAARAQGRALRHLGQLDIDGRARVGVVALPADHACCHTRLTDNLVQFRSARYADNPLVVQGPGAGPEVTAAGVFGDVLAVAHALGAQAGLPFARPAQALA